MCLYPKLIKNKKYQANKKNGGNIPSIPDERVKYVAIGCQNCIECRKQKARSWQVRLLEDIKTNKNGKFITLTFTDESIKKIIEMPATKNWPGMGDLTGYDLDNEIATRATRLFLERWRKEYNKSLRHWLVTELGHNGSENIHLHGIVWTDEPLTKLENIWEYGYVWKGKENAKGHLTNYVNEKTVNYITKYVTKVDLKHSKYKSKILTSPGIGNNYTKSGDYKNNIYKGNKTEETYRTRTGHKMAMPIYWRNKIYSETQREQLWINKLDEECRYILGSKIDVSENTEEYYRGLDYARELNKRLGYGDDSENWEKEQYERNRRTMMQKARIEKASMTGNKDKKRSAEQ